MTPEQIKQLKQALVDVAAISEDGAVDAHLEEIQALVLALIDQHEDLLRCKVLAHVKGLKLRTFFNDQQLRTWERLVANEAPVAYAVSAHEGGYLDLPTMLLALLEALIQINHRTQEALIDNLAMRPVRIIMDPKGPVDPSSN